MKNLQHLFGNKQFVKFLLTGGVAATLNFGSRFVYSFFMAFDLAIIFAFFTGLASGYILTRLFVFTDGRHSRTKEITYYTLVNLIALIQTWVISVILAHHILPHVFSASTSEALGHLAGVVFPVFTSYIGHRYFTFTMSEKSTAQETLQKQYSARFSAVEQYRNNMWKILCSNYFQKIIPSEASVLDIGCGWGEFISNINAKQKFAIDLNPEAKRLLPEDVTFINQSCTAPWPLQKNSLDVIFTSNFLEHLPNKEAVEETLLQARQFLKPTGKIICMGPNIKYLAGDYWDYWDHHVAISDNSLAEILQLSGFTVVKKLKKFLPYTMSEGNTPPLFLVKAYLKLPFAWRLLGKQFLIIATPKNNSSLN